MISCPPSSKTAGAACTSLLLPALLFFASGSALPAQTSAPADDVMRPTRHGVRFTPELAEGFARNWLRDVSPGLDLDPSQRQAMTQAIADRMLATARANHRQGRDAIEFAYESLIGSEGKFTPEMGREFARRAQPLLPAFREFMNNVGNDAQRILPPEQFEEFREDLQRKQRELDRFDRRMQRWARGEIREKENPFDGGGDDEEIDDPAQRLRNDRRRRIRRDAERVIRDVGPPAWEQFLNSARHVFKFDDAQYASATQLLADFKAIAADVMTDEWKAVLRRNRHQWSFRQQLSDPDLAPWWFHLDREYKELIEPLVHIGREFRRAVLAVATDAQREAVLVEMRENAAKHGLTLEVFDATLLGLTASQPAQP